MADPGDEPTAGLEAEVERLLAENAALKGLVEVLEARIAKLEREAGRDSQNSGRPPSSDTLADKAKQDERRKSRAERRREARAKAKKLSQEPKRRPGKQPGEPGATLARVEDPEVVVDHRPAECSGCGAGLDDAEVIAVEDRQVFDLPTRRLEVTEHRAETRRCSCGATTKAAFPPEARGTACYGPLLRAIGVYLMAGQHLPVARVAALLGEVCDAPVSTGWLAVLSAEAEAGLGGFLAVLKAQLIAEDAIHADETGARICGARYWFHVACTDLITLLDCHPKRGKEAFDDLGVLPFFSGVLISDGWKSYWSYGAVEHALCCAHLLRDLASVAEADRHQAWADGLAELLVEAKNAVDTAIADGHDGLDRAQLRRFRSAYTKLVNQGRRCVRAGHRTGSVDRDAHNLLNRFDAQRGDIQRHWHNPFASFDNNQAERDLRMVKLQQKISGCFRTLAGAKAFCAVRSYLQTADKHGLPRLAVLTQLFQGDAWIPPPAGSGASP